jgi:hypothetical protein
LISQTFEDFSPNVIENQLEYLVKEVKSRATKRKMREIILDNSKKLDSEDPYVNLERTVSQLSLLRPRDAASSSLTDHTAMSRYEKYLVKKEDVSLDGRFKTGFDFFDTRRVYWSPGEFSAFVARPFVGKTTALIHTSAVNWSNGGRILLVSPELGIPETERRLDVFCANLLNKPISLNDLRYGHLDSKDNYEQYAKIASSRRDIEVIDSIQGRKVTPSRLNTLCEVFKPTIVAIDGIKFVEDDERARQGWEVIFNVGIGLKRLALGQSTVVLTVQQVKPEVPAHRVPGPEQVSYGDALFQSVDRLITMSLNEETDEARDYTVQKDRISGEPLLERQKSEFLPAIGRLGRAMP